MPHICTERLPYCGQGLSDTVNKMSVTVEFTIKGDQLKPIVCDTERGSDVNRVHEEAKTSNTSFGYSGRHDHGSLPELKSSGSMARLVASLGDAKRESDTVLTEIIKREKQADDPPPDKKPRIEEDGAGEKE